MQQLTVQVESMPTPAPSRTDSDRLRSNLGKLHACDLEIDRTFHSLLRSPRSSEVVNNANSDSNFGIDTFKFSMDNMADNNKTLKELVTPNVMCQPWCILYRELEQAQSYELKFGLIHLLLKFHGLAGEDPHKHLKEFHVMCSTMRPHGIPEGYIKMKTFPFSLDGVAKD
ncbi:hypothetical protein CR513_39168, partial [Mucuna pruriens]